MTLNELAFSRSFLRVIGALRNATDGDLCQIQTPNIPDEESNDGFIIHNLNKGDYYQVVTEMTDERREMSEEFEFFIIEWKNFPKYFEALDENHPVVDRYRRKEKERAHLAAVSDKENFHWILFICAGVCFLLGLILAGAGNNLTDNSTWFVVAGAMMITASVAGSVVSELWQEVEKLSGVKAFLAWLPTVLGGIAISLLLLFYFAGKEQRTRRSLPK